MNILELQDKLKNFSKQQLVSEMQKPSGQVPQYLILTELDRRKRMEMDMQSQMAKNQPTVAEEVVAAAGVPQGGIMEAARAMAPKSSIAQNDGVQQMADGGAVKMQTGGLITAIANLKVNYPEVYAQYKDSPDLNKIAEAAMDGMVAVTPELTGLEQMEAGRSFDALRSLFTDPSNRAVTKKAAEIEAMQPELNAAAEAQRNAALASGAYDSDAPYVEDITNVIGRPDNPFIVDPARIVQSQDTKSPTSGEFYGNQIQLGKNLDIRDTEGYIQGTGMGSALPDRPVGYDRTGSEQSFVLQRPEGAVLNVPSTMGGDRPSGFDASTFKTFDVRSGMGDVYAEPEKVRAAEDAALSGIGSLRGPLTMDEAAAAAARQRIESPISPQVEQPMLVDQMATASIKDESPMIAELARQDEIKRMMEINEIPEPSPEAGPISSALVDLGEAGIESLGSSFEAGVDALQSLTEGGDGMPEPTPESALPEGFRLGDGTSAEGGLSFGELLTSSTEGKDDKVTGTKAVQSSSKGKSSIGGVEGEISQMLKDREKAAEQDKWMALAQTGLALMASKQPTLGGAIGEAGMVGISELGKSKKSYRDDKLALMTLQQRAQAARSRLKSSGSKGLTASNMISLMDDLRKYKGDIQDRINALNDPMNMLDDAAKAAQLQSLQAELMRTDIELGTYRNALRGGGSSTTPIDVRGGSQTQSGVGYSLGTTTQ